MKVLLIATSFNGLTQRIHRELSLQGFEVSVELSLSDEAMIEAATAYNPDIVVCPFLKERIPDCIWEKYPCLIVHPGIEGDRGPSSIDWALMLNEPEWGVTVLQAAGEMDGGDIWGTGNFPLRRAGKASIYRREVSSEAVRLVKQALKDFQNPQFSPWPLDYDNPAVKGRERPLMLQADRRIDWGADTTEQIVRKINAAEGCPGVQDALLGQAVSLYGAVADRQLAGEPGALLAHNGSAICRATIDGAVWIRMARCRVGPDSACIKLPAWQVLQNINREQKGGRLNLKYLPDAIPDIRVREVGGVAYLHFDFYNGAMSTGQCRDLQKTLKSLKKRSIKVIVLMGGEDFWSNGIHLNTIEAAEDPAKESWANIQAMDDLVLEIIDSPKHLIIAALRCNAGAGGAVMPLACDRVLLRDGVVLNMHYATMGLYGSEYWTYLLPRRVGAARATQLMQQCMPTLAREAILLGIGDELFDEDWDRYQSSVEEYATQLAHSADFDKLLLAKRNERKADEKVKKLKVYREEELQHMRQNFFDPASEYHRRRYEFVHKLPPQSTPLRLAVHRDGRADLPVDAVSRETGLFDASSPV